MFINSIFFVFSLVSFVSVSLFLLFVLLLVFRIITPYLSVKCVALHAQEVLGLLQEPSAAEVSSLHIPPLEPAPTPVGSGGYGELVQWRMQRVWNLLQSPALFKLDMVIKYSTWGGFDLLENALACWEEACAAVVLRERTLKTLVHVRPMYRLAHPKNYLFSLFTRIFSGSECPKHMFI